MVEVRMDDPAAISAAVVVADAEGADDFIMVVEVGVDGLESMYSAIPATAMPPMINTVFVPPPDTLRLLFFVAIL